MSLTALCYLGVRTQSLDQWSEFANGVLGMQQVDRGGKSNSYRMDDHKQRLVVEQKSGHSLAFMGWEVSDQQSLGQLAGTLDAADIKVNHGDRSLCDQRFVTDLIYFNDPDGNRIELVWKPHTTTDAFIPGRPISGFNTGPYGLGHAVLHVRDVNALLPFYRDLLGFNVSDYGLSPYPMYFFHINGRHHSFAMIGSGDSGLHHFMVEFQNLDDVGQGYDLAQLEDDRIAYTLGRHTNDYMTSFYAHTPSGFFVESGWGGRVIDPATWEPHETTMGPSFWGHERLYLSEPQRSRLRDMRLQAAADGLQAPLLPDCPWMFEQFNKST